MCRSSHFALFTLLLVLVPFAFASYNGRTFRLSDIDDMNKLRDPTLNHLDVFKPTDDLIKEQRDVIERNRAAFDAIFSHSGNQANSMNGQKIIQIVLKLFLICCLEIKFINFLSSVLEMNSTSNDFSGNLVKIFVGGIFLFIGCVFWVFIGKLVLKRCANCCSKESEQSRPIEMMTNSSASMQSDQRNRTQIVQGSAPAYPSSPTGPVIPNSANQPFNQSDHLYPSYPSYPTAPSPHAYENVGYVPQSFSH